MVEKLSKFIHEECWMVFAKGVYRTEPNLSHERKERWEKECFMPYEELSDDQKENDRYFARKLIQLLNDKN